MRVALPFRRTALHSGTMLGIHHYWLFLATAIVLILTPGQDTFFILGRSLAGGRAAGVAAALGVSAGTVVHTLLAALGLSALLATSAYAFMAVKFAGAAYLIFLGVRALLSRSRSLGLQAGTDSRAGRWPAFRQGMLTNLLNPKVALFFLALMPQFIAVASTQKVAAFLALGLSFVTLGLVWCVVLAVGAAALREAFLRRPSLGAALDKVAGALFIGLGIRLATARQ